MTTFRWRWVDLLHPFELYQRYQWYKFGLALKTDIESRMQRKGFMESLLEKEEFKNEQP